jgi:hypothetical protein
MSPSALRDASVFVNVPFDPPYEPLFLSLLTGLVCLGRVPRTVLELDASTARLDRLIAIIDSCASSVHDLSRVQTTPSSYGRLPRFNMPFELGLACSRNYHSQHEFFIFEEKSHRLQISTSDLNGFDPLIHGGTIDGILDATLDAFGRASGRDPTPEMLRRVASEVRRFARTKLISRDKSQVFKRNGFQQVVAAAAGLARDHGLIA